jgi:hypothetical protein
MFLLSSVLVSCWTCHVVNALTPPGSWCPNSFSLSSHYQNSARHTCQAMDATRMHFQILLVDSDNVKGRIAEGLLAKIADYNDARLVIFPASATMILDDKTPRDAAPSASVIQICRLLQLCPELTRATTTTASQHEQHNDNDNNSIITQLGTQFSMSYLDDYDLIVCMDDDIQTRILRALEMEHQDYYGPRIRLLSEFTSPDFYASIRPTTTTTTTTSSSSKNDNINDNVVSMLSPDLWNHVQDHVDMVMNRSSSIFAYTAAGGGGGDIALDKEWPLVQAAMIVACAGICRFSLDVMDAHVEEAFQALLERNFCRPEHVPGTLMTPPLEEQKEDHAFWNQADDQLRKSSFAITGYFSPQQRRTRLQNHVDQLRRKFGTYNNQP